MRPRSIHRRRGYVEVGIVLTLAVSLGGCGLFAQQSPSKSASPPSSQPTSLKQPQTSTIADTPGTVVQIHGAALTMTASPQLTFSGSGFTGGEALAVNIANTQGTAETSLESVHADHNGNVHSATLAVPTSLTPGTHLLVVQGETSQHIGHATFQVKRIPPTVQLDSYADAPGYAFGVSGNGFAANEKVNAYFGSTKNAPVATFQSGAGGNLMGRITVPTLRPGEYTLYFLGQTSATPAAVAFDIQAFKPWVTLDNYAPAAGAIVRASGHDFAPNERVLVYFNTTSGQPLTPVQANGRGEFTNASVLTVSDGMTGDQTLTFVGERSHASAQVALQVLPATESPASGTPSTGTP